MAVLPDGLSELCSSVLPVALLQDQLRGGQLRLGGCGRLSVVLLSLDLLLLFFLCCFSRDGTTASMVQGCACVVLLGKLVLLMCTLHNVAGD